MSQIKLACKAQETELDSDYGMFTPEVSHNEGTSFQKDG